MTEQRNDESSTIEEQLLQIKNPFQESIQSFEKIISWGLAISVGSLLWFAGNFDKFTIKCDQGNTSIPFHLLYFSAVSVLSISTLSFGFIQLKLYYSKFKYSSETESAVAKLNNILNKIRGADFSHAPNDQLLAFYEELMAASSTARNVSEDLTTSNEYIFSNKNKIISLIGGIFYLFGVFLVGLYYCKFIYNYR
jgi:hypothetical protein